MFVKGISEWFREFLTQEFFGASQVLHSILWLVRSNQAMREKFIEKQRWYMPDIEVS